MTQPFPELGCYGLAGHTESPADLLDEIRFAETLGVGAMFLSERFNLKDAGVLAGAAATISHRIGIGTAATNHNTRHPLVTATMATTLHRLSGGRYALGLGRGFDALFDVMGLPRVTGAQLEDVIGIYRTLWSGGSVLGHEGPAGSYPYLSQDSSFDEQIPILLMAIGERTLRLAGRVADGVVLHTFLTDEALARSVRIVRESAEEAGRDPSKVRIWAVLATVEESVPEEVALRKTVGRLATYLQGYGQVLVDANGWSRDDLERFRQDPLVDGYPGAFDAVGTTEQLGYLRDELIPAEWLAASATGLGGDLRRPHRRPVRGWRRQRDPARCHAVRAGAGGRGVERSPRPGPVRGAPRQPGMVAVTSGDVVCGPELLTSAWLSAALGRTVEVRSVDAVGTGQIGACYRVTMAGDQGRETVLAKLPAADPGTREMLAGAYRGEVTFYADLAATVAVVVPRCEYAAIRPGTGDFTLLLEDLAPAVQGDQLGGCSVAQARAAVVNLAGPARSPLVRPDPDAGARTLRERPRRRRDPRGALRPGDRDLRRRAADRCSPTTTSTRCTACVEVAERWALGRAERFALVHGDYRLDNLMFDDESVWAVDWQTLSLALPARDLAYFVGTSLDEDDRRASEEELVAAYHSALRGHGVSSYSLEQCWDDYRFAMVQGPLVAVFGYAYGTRTERGDRMFAAMVRRACAAIRDLDTLALV